MTPIRPHVLLFVLLAALTSACSSQMDEIDTPIVRPSTPAPAGIYVGEVISIRDQTSTPITVFVDGASRMFAFSENESFIASGLYTAASRSLSWQARIFKPGVVAGVPATIVTTGNASGSFHPETNLLLAYTTSAGDSGSINVTYAAARYQQRSDLPLLAGVWAVEDPFGSPTISLSIGTGGEFFGQGSGCNYSGNFSLINLRYNLYRLALNIQCTNEATPRQTTGLATLVTTSATAKPVLELVTTSATMGLVLMLKQP